MLPSWERAGFHLPTIHPGIPNPAELTKDRPSETHTLIFQGEHGGSFPYLPIICLIHLLSFVSFSGRSAFLVFFFSAYPPVPLSHFRSCIFSEGQEEVSSWASPQQAFLLVALLVLASKMPFHG